MEFFTLKNITTCKAALTHRAENTPFFSTNLAPKKVHIKLMSILPYARKAIIFF